MLDLIIRFAEVLMSYCQKESFAYTVFELLPTVVVDVRWWSPARLKMTTSAPYAKTISCMYVCVEIALIAFKYCIVHLVVTMVSYFQYFRVL